MVRFGKRYFFLFLFIRILSPSFPLSDRRLSCMLIPHDGLKRKENLQERLIFLIAVVGLC